MHKLIFNLDKTGSMPNPIVIRQGDYGALTRISVELRQDNEPIVFSSGDEVTFYGTTADDHKIIADFDMPSAIGHDKVTFDFPSAAGATAGDFKRAYIAYSRDGSVVSTFDIMVRVLPAIDITVSDADNYLSRYDSMLASMLSGASGIDHLVDSAEAIVSSTASFATIASSLASTASDYADEVVSLANDASSAADNMANASDSASSYADAASQFAAVASTMKDSASYDESVIATLLEAANSNAIQTSAYEVLASTHEYNASVYASQAQSLNEQVSTIVKSVSSMNSTIGLYLTAAHDGASMVDDAVYSASRNADVASSIAVIVNSLHSTVSLNASQTASYQSFASNKASTASSYADNASNAAKSASSYAVTASSATADVLSNSAVVDDIISDLNETYLQPVTFASGAPSGLNGSVDKLGAVRIYGTCKPGKVLVAGATNANIATLASNRPNVTKRGFAIIYDPQTAPNYLTDYIWINSAGFIALKNFTTTVNTEITLLITY